MDRLPFEWLGSQLYEPTWELLQHRAAAVAASKASEIIWSCEHEPVYTTGRRAVDNREQPILPAPLIYTDRGGETTFHGTGQIMLYPIIHLRRRQITPKQYVSLLEQSAIDLLADMGVNAARRCSLPGVWTKEGKIVAIGLRIQNGVAYHGMALNVDVASEWFSAINPCGTGKKSVSLSDYIEKPEPLEMIATQWSNQLDLLLGRN
ncbi:MAG TPA: lipoyl(octanoyl) transferase LipB [Mariprofundaceae bacterium]|nr:lipoyl(octanoyl) transferase LipB [Mariprofundaceae bacterium]